MMDLSGRHASVRQVAQWFAYDHLAGDARAVSQQCHDLAKRMITALPDSAELTVGLRKLVEAKDCLVRCTLAPPAADPVRGVAPPDPEQPADSAKPWLPHGRPIPGPEEFQPPGRRSEP